MRRAQLGCRFWSQVLQPTFLARLHRAVPEHFEKCSSMTFFVRHSGSMPATFAVQLIVALPCCRRLVGLAAAPWGSKIMESVPALSTSLMRRTMQSHPLGAACTRCKHEVQSRRAATLASTARVNLPRARAPHDADSA